MDDQEFNAILSDVCFKSSNYSNNIDVFNLSKKSIQHETPKKEHNSLNTNKKLIELRRNSNTFFEKEQNECSHLSQHETNKLSLTSKSKKKKFESEQQLQISSNDLIDLTDSTRKR